MLPCHQVDVFASDFCTGNPVAVVHEAEGLSAERMAAFANRTNLSETTFLLPPTDPAADYRLRIFTTARELPFAGHPTLGSARARLEAGGVPASDTEIVQQCDAGLVRIRQRHRARGPRLHQRGAHRGPGARHQRHHRPLSRHPRMPHGRLGAGVRP